ncbi:related to gibberellin 20-oxidase [Phialocephala subalpina]|uniref:Related to gibberellin 20-oxidase n=1 Tax=Phialocephala subalpina TaxID=576137 RepID=A0A1L7XIZ3_9HELO|nr:related to gibberellin 20-oxidase [Phialocephala subalpina]
MPTENLFASVPPFPVDVPIARLSTISLEKLLALDEKESAKLFDGCKKDGFFLLDLRGVPIGLSLIAVVEELFKVNKTLFDEGPEELGKYTFPPPGILGYNAFGSTKVESGLPDRFEWYCMSQDDILGTAAPAPNPASIETNRTILNSFVKASHYIASQVLLQLDRHLRLPEGTLESRQKLHEESGSIIRLLKYPPQPESDRRTSLFGHTDVGTVTLLFNVLGGLQILPAGSENKEENWRYVKPQQGCVIVNLGDTMREWTGGILRSNIHRVTFPPGEQGDFTRYSLAYLMRAESGASMKRLALKGSLIEPVKQGEEEIEITADEWVSRKTALARSAKDPASARDGRGAQTS